MKKFFLIIFLIFIASCKESEGPAQSSSISANCKGEYTVKNSNGFVTNRFNEYYVNSLGCVTDNLPLSTFEKQELVRYQHNITCKPQNIPSVTLISKNNYLSTRNDSIYLDLDSSSGQFRRLIVGQTADGVPLFQREIGCWFQRTDNITESYGARDYGLQILLDLEEASSSLEVHPMEVYRYVRAGSNWDTVRFDDPSGVDWTFCNPEGLPFQYCTALRNGNYMYYPDNLSAATMAALQAEAILIRSQYNFIEINKSAFESKWGQTIGTAKEFGTAEAIKNNYKFQFGISGFPDLPFYIDRSWRSFLRGEAPQMPDTSSITIPPICYNGKRDVTLNDGTIGIVYGQICYVGGIYTFTQQ